MQADTMSQETSTGSLFQRVDRLEKENRSLKRLVLIICLVAGALFVMGQSRPVPKVIEAEKFVLKDNKGQEKATLSMTSSGPELTIRNVDAKRATRSSIGAGTMHMYSTDLDKELTMNMGPGGVGFTISEKGQDQGVSIYATGPTIELSDKQGFQTTIGATSLETPKTGETHNTSAASIVVFDKDKSVIWKAPVRQ